ncbi:MAG TPA: hypothetical protein VEC11_12905 [Allosphingosinicella sp.]|nr:hypothetical protein [Allosphingosinicella sp.]
MTGQASRAGWKLEPQARAVLLERFPPCYACAVADHVTLKPDLAGEELPPAPGEALIVGRADDGAGVEAMVVRLDGTTDRPDGSTWHITWSLGPGREAKESNDVIAARGWAEFDEAVPVTLVPARWP